MQSQTEQTDEDPPQDTLWSAQEDAQLIGRIWRYPQPKLVHVYRLIAGHTPDVFLNNIAFDKSVMLDHFKEAPPVLRKCTPTHSTCRASTAEHPDREHRHRRKRH